MHISWLKSDGYPVSRLTPHVLFYRGLLAIVGLRWDGMESDWQLYRDAAATSVESALMPWNGRHDVLIDRFDARAVLDMVPLSPKVQTR